MVWERWAEEKGAHVLTAAVCAGAGREQRQADRRRCRCSEGTMMIAAAAASSPWLLVVAGRRVSRQKQESRALPPPWVVLKASRESTGAD